MFFVLSLFLLLGKWLEDVDDADLGHSNHFFSCAILSALVIFVCKEMYS